MDQRIFNRPPPSLASTLIAVYLLASLSAIAQTNALRPWNTYRAIMWVGDSAYKKPEKLPLFFQRVHEIGINTAMVYGDGDLKPLLDNQFPYYVENIVNQGLCLKFNSKVTDWDKFVTEWARSGRPESALTRDYCLDDPQWQNRAAALMQNAARKNRAHEPLAYNIRDELSTTISANPFDYDFNPIAQDGYRQWLKTQYRDLTDLNSEWETKFNSWEEVRPFTTDQIKNRMGSGAPAPRGKPDWQQVQGLKFDPVAAQREATRWNFSPWADFRTYMDLSLAHALNRLRHAAHEIDPATPVGVEGTQMPHAFGGYDLWRLSQAVDWIEPYDIGNAREILGSFMPGKPIVTTVFESDANHARRRLWHLLLEGDRGCIVWWSEDCIDWKANDYSLTPKAKALGPVLREMTGPLGQLFLRAEREFDPIYILYSQPSIQVDWLLESTVDGSTWLRRFSSYEAEHNHMTKVRNSWVKIFQDMGFTPRFISSDQLSFEPTITSGPAVLVLPTSWALQAREIMAIRRFLGIGAAENNQRAAFSDVTPGLFDEHGKLRTSNALSDYFVVSASNHARAATTLGVNTEAPPGDITAYLTERQANPEAARWTDWIALQSKLEPPVSALASNCVRIHRFHSDGNRLIAFERNVDYHMSEELKQAGGNEGLEKAAEIEASLATAAHIYDLRAQKYIGHSNKLRFTLDPWQPSLFALTPDKLRSDAVLEELSRTPATGARQHIK